MRRLAIALLVMVTILMGAVGWMLGRPGILRPEPQVFAAPAQAPEDLPRENRRTVDRGAPSMNAHGGHTEARGE